MSPELKLNDCQLHGREVNNELYLVEGDSAASSVSRVRNRSLQAVLPMQGKPLNARKASQARVLKNLWFKAFINALGCGIKTGCQPDAMRYQRVMLLFDPDADGIHCGALMLIFLHCYMPALLEDKRVWMVRAPLFRITAPALEQPLYANSERHYKALIVQLQTRKIRQVQTLRYRGLGSLEADLLIDSCVAPQTRQAEAVSPEFAQIAMRIFGG